jgi:serine/threonine protein kinase
MPLAPGSKLGPYEIISPLGAGGMGEVYRAKDTRLDRTVAVKILPTQFTSDPVSKQRFEREAKAISSLNHPNICVLFDIGHQDGTDYIVMECVEGEALSKRLEKGPLPFDQTLRFGAQIAEALDRAHRSGIVHRDLKPGNIMLTASGAKLLDFGLAKQSTPLADLATMTAVSPTSPVTQQGTIVGTFQYMSPEQVEGKEVDGRSDIFSLGAVLYEMLTGKRAFEGKTQLSVASAILEREPESLTTIKPFTPPALEHAIQRCLAKDREDRWQTGRDLANELKWVQQSGSQTAARPVQIPHHFPRERWLWSVALLLALAAGLAAGKLFHRDAGVPDLRVSVNLPPSYRLETESALALSPDGRTLAFAGSGPDGLRRLWARSLNGQQPQSLNGTEDASYPFWSPDNRFLGFFANHKLKKVEVSSGSVTTLCDAQSGRGGTWNSDGLIVFTPTFLSGLYQISESGGQPVQLTTPENTNTSHRLAHFLPDGKHVIFLRAETGNAKGVFILDLESKKQEKLSEEQTDTRYVAPGYLVFLRGGNLMAQPFDASSHRTTGEPSILAEGVEFTPSRYTGQFSFSSVETGVYQTGAATPSQLTIFDENGKRLNTAGNPQFFEPQFILAPDGQRVALLVHDAKASFVWVQDLSTGTGSRLTFGNLSFIDVAWSKDGKQVAYGTNEGRLYTQPSDGSAPPSLLFAGEFPTYPSSYSPDGKVLAISGSTGQGVSIFILPLTGGNKLIPFVIGPGWKLAATFSPDGRWIAYASDESGRPEIYIVPYPGPGGKLQVSTAGGQSPNWLNGGRELAYINADRKLVVAQLNGGGQQLQIGQTRELFGGRPLPVTPGYIFDAQTAPPAYITSDGKRIILPIPTDLDSVRPLNLITHWTAGLKK